MVKQATSSTKEISKQNNLLRKENMELRRELDNAKISSSRKSSAFLRITGIGLISAIAASVLISGNLVFWAGRSLVDTDRYIAITAPLIEQPAVQQALANEITTALYKQVDVEAITEQVLPPKASFLAPQLATQLESYTKQTVQTILASQKFQDVWAEAQTTIHNKVITAIKDYKGNGVVNLNDLFDKVTAQLGDTKLSFLVDKQLPDSIGSITIIDAAWLPVAHNLVVNMNLYRFLSILIFLLATAGAIILSKNRRKQVILLSLLYAMCALITLIAIGLTKNLLISNAQEVNQQAVKEVANIVFSSLIIQTRLLLASSLIVWLLAWISGPYKSALFFRDRINVLLSGNIHKSLFGKSENRLTRFVGKNQMKLFWGYTSIVAVMLIFTSISAGRLVAFVVSVALAAVILEILAETKQ